MPPTSAIGRYSIAPAAAFATTGRDVRAAVTREHEPGRARGLRDAHDGAEVARIAHAVERDEERVLGAPAARRDRRRAAARRSRPRPAARRCAPAASMRSGSTTLQRAARQLDGSRRPGSSRSTELDTDTARTGAGPRAGARARRAGLPPAPPPQRLASARPVLGARGGHQLGARPCRSACPRARCRAEQLVADAVGARPSPWRRAPRRAAATSAATSLVDLGRRRRGARARARRRAIARSRRASAASSCRPSSSAVFASRRSFCSTATRGRRVEVVVHRGAELGATSTAGDRRGGFAARARRSSVSKLSTSFSASPSSFVADLHLAAVVRLQHEHAERARVVAVEHVGEGREVAERLRHLLAVRR